MHAYITFVHFFNVTGVPKSCMEASLETVHTVLNPSVTAAARLKWVNMSKVTDALLCLYF